MEKVPSTMLSEQAGFVSIHSCFLLKRHNPSDNGRAVAPLHDNNSFLGCSGADVATIGSAAGGISMPVPIVPNRDKSSTQSVPRRRDCSGVDRPNARPVTSEGLRFRKEVQSRRWRMGRR
jgi:hypothetical protein